MSMIPRCAVCDDAVDPYSGDTGCGGGSSCRRYPAKKEDRRER